MDDLDDSEKLAEVLRRIEEQMKEFEEAFKLLKAELDRIQQDMDNGSQKSTFRPEQDC
jgi:soluble cytochrome b562